jgi:DNA-binding NarL/FixJ family response regulator
MLQTLLIEDNLRLQEALKIGLEATGEVDILAAFAKGEDALAYCLGGHEVHVLLMDVALAGEMNGIEAAVAIRREFPRLPVVFYSIADDDAYFRAFRRSGILTHYAYVRKSNYLLPEMILPLLRDAITGRSFVDPDIAARVQEVRHRDEQAPIDLLEPNEQIVVRLLGQGLTNEQIAERLGFQDKRTISRTNGQIYAAWGLVESTTDEKVARTRAAIIVHTGLLIQWDINGRACVLNERREWVEWSLSGDH